MIKMALAATLSLILVKASVGASLHIEDFRFVETSRGDIVEPSAKITFLSEEARNHLPPRPSSGFVGSVSSLPLGAKIGISIIFALLATSVLGLAGWLSYVNLRRGIALASISGCLFALSGVFAWLASPY